MKMVRLSDIENKHVLEVGPGQGALTVFLAELAKDVTCYEIDETLKPILDDIEKRHENLRIIYQDFMTADLSDLPDEVHVVANVPYYITTPILFRILETPSIRSASLMIQKEVLERLLAKPEMKAYNALSVVLQYHAEASKMMDVKRHLFFPVPNVDSAVIRIVKRSSGLLDADREAIFLRLVKEAFRQKRKTIQNNWHEAFGTPKKEIESFLTSLGYRSDSRGEQMSLEDFIRMAKEWKHD